MSCKKREKDDTALLCSQFVKIAYKTVFAAYTAVCEHNVHVLRMFLKKVRNTNKKHRFRTFLYFLRLQGILCAYLQKCEIPTKNTVFAHFSIFLAYRAYYAHISKSAKYPPKTRFSHISLFCWLTRHIMRIFPKVRNTP